MTLKIKRLAGTENEPFCVEIQNFWPDPTMILIHLERLSDVKVLSKASAAMTDDIQIEFIYKGFPFILTSPYSYLCISTASPEVPESVFEEVVKHVENYKAVWPHQILMGIIRHMKLPRWKRSDRSGR
jgi:hypothetical protein